MLSIDNIDQAYGDTQILWGMGLNIHAGSRTCIMGRNGVGKTTLMKTIMGLLPIRQGSITWQNQAIEKKPAEARAPMGIAYVPQGRDIFPQLTVEENIRIGLRARPDKVLEIPERIFSLFPVLKKMLNRRGGDLSGGQQQQLAIARALAIDPKILILDEPNEGIQPNVVNDISNILIELNEKENLTLLLVEQKINLARRIGQHYVLMERGRAVSEGTMNLLTDDLIKKHLAV